MSYLLRIDNISSSTVWRERPAPLVTVPGADEDAPLGRIEEGGVSERFRFASDGDVEAGGKTGGVRTPLVVVVAAMVVSADDGSTVRDAGEMDALRAADGSRRWKA
jgi:hypothetical protein